MSLELCDRIGQQVLQLNTTAAVYNGEGGLTIYDKTSSFVICHYDNVWGDEEPASVEDPYGSCTTKIDTDILMRDTASVGQIQFYNFNKTLTYDYSTILRDDECTMQVFEDSCKSYKDELIQFDKEKRENKKLCKNEHDEEACEQDATSYTKQNRKVLLKQLKKCYQENKKSQMKEQDKHDAEDIKKHKKLQNALMKTKLKEHKGKGKDKGKGKGKGKSKGDNKENKPNPNDDNPYPVQLGRTVICDDRSNPNWSTNFISCYEFTLTETAQAQYECTYLETSESSEITDAGGFQLPGVLAEANGTITFDDFAFGVNINNRRKGDEYDCFVYAM